MSSITNIPDEILIKILNYLSIKQLLKCRLINKRFNYNINNLNLKRLFIYNSNQIKETGLINNLRSFLNYDKEVDLNHYICVLNYTDISLNKIFNCIFLKNLRELYFVHTQHLIRSTTLFELTNKFQSLEILEICYTFNTGGDYQLNLMNLKLLSIGSISEELEDDDFKVIINCPNLEKLKVFGIIVYVFELINPNKIKFLEIDFYEKWLDDLVNLETLSCLNISGLNENTLNKLIKLKELKFYQPNYGIWNLKQIKNKLKNKFDIYFCDILVDDNIINHNEDFTESILSAFDRFVESSTKQYSFQIILENYPKISPELCIQSIDYNVLENYFKTNIPDDLIRRLVNLKFIIIDKPINEDLFKKFIQNFSTLNYLKLCNCKLSQQFYSNELTKLCPFLKFLTIKDKECNNFKFLLEFKNLNKIRIDQNLYDNQIIINCFNKFKDQYFNQFKFYYHNIKIKISVASNGDYSLKKGSKKRPEFYFSIDILILNLNRFINEKLNIQKNNSINFDIQMDTN